MNLSEHEQIIIRYKQCKQELIDQVINKICEIGSSNTADLLGWSRQQVSNLKTNRQVSYENLIEIAKILEKGSQ